MMTSTKSLHRMIGILIIDTPVILENNLHLDIFKDALMEGLIKPASNCCRI